MFSSLNSSLVQFASSLSLDNLQSSDGSSAPAGVAAGSDTKTDAVEIHTDSFPRPNLAASSAPSHDARVEKLEMELERQTAITLSTKELLQLKTREVNELRDLAEQSQLREQEALDKLSLADEKLKIVISKTKALDSKRTDEILQLKQEVSRLNDSMALMHSQNEARLQTSGEEVAPTNDALASDLLRQVEYHKSTAASLQSQVTTLRDQLTTTSEELEAATADSESKDAQMVEQEKRLRSAMSQVLALEEKAKATAQELDSQLAVAADREATLATQLRESSERESRLSDQIKAVSERESALVQQLSMASEREVLLANEVAALKSTSAVEAMLHSEVEELKVQCSVKDSSIEDLQAKLKQLTEKMRDMMKKYAEAKASSSNVGQEVAAAHAATQARESECLSLRMKLENNEGTILDLRQRCKLSEDSALNLQREIVRTRANETQLEGLVKDLSEEKLALADALSTARSERDSLVERLSASQQTIESLNASIHTLKIESHQASAHVTEELQRRLDEARLQKEELETRLQADANNAKVFEDYKKRAQSALKAANHSTSVAMVEVKRLTEALEEAEGRVSALEERVLELEQVLEARQTELQASSQGIEDKQTEISLLEDKIASLTEALSRSEFARDELVAHNRHIDSGHPVEQRLADESESGVHTAVVLESTLNPDERRLDKPAAARIKRPAPIRTHEAPLPVSEEPVDSPRGYAALLNSNSTASTSASPSSADHRTASLLATPTSNHNNAHASATTATDAATVTVTDRDEADNTTKVGHSEQLVLVTKLLTQMDSMRREAVEKDIELEAVSSSLAEEKAQRVKLSLKIEQMTAYLERLQQQEGPDSGTSMEYLKNCIFKYMSSTHRNERVRLYPVIATILKLTAAERAEIEVALQAQTLTNQIASTLGAAPTSSGHGAATADSGVISSLGAFAANLFG